MQALYPTSPNELSDDDLTELYAYPSERRWLRSNFVTSVDGAAQGVDAKSGTLSSRADKRIFALLRSLSDVIVVGAGTARAEGYQPVQHSEARAELRTQHGLAPLPAMAVVSRSLELDAGLLAGTGGPVVVITTTSAPRESLARLGEAVQVVAAGEVDVDLSQAVDQLAALGYQRMLCEGGPRLMRDLVAAGLVDELCLTTSPVLVGGDRLRLTQGDTLEPAVPFRLRHLLEADSQLFARYTKA